jgi:hypothetical protein
MKLICLKSHLGNHPLALTEGKIYDNIDSDGFGFYIDERNAHYWQNGEKNK